MKRALILSLAVLMIFGAVAFAGPTIGTAFVPVTGFPATLVVGYDFGGISIEAVKGDFTTPFGQFILGTLWTPLLGTEGFGYRAGVRLLLDWQIGGFIYDGFGFALGVSQTWGPIQIYGEIDLFPTGLLQAVPIIGVNVLFSELIPDKVVD